MKKDLEYGTFFIRTNITNNCVVEQGFYAHQAYKNILVHEFSIVENSECNSIDIHVSVNEGDPSNDIDFQTTINTSNTFYFGEIEQTETQVSSFYSNTFFFIYYEIRLV